MYDSTVAIESAHAPPALAPASACGGNRGLLECAQALHRDGRDLVLAIVTATAGSTYQKPGALVLLDQQGVRAGVVSGGCLEPELELQAREVLAAGRARLVEFNTQSDDDLVFGSGIGCRGQIWVMLLPQPARADAALLAALASAQQHGLSLTVQFDDTPAPGAGQAGHAGRQWHWDARGVACDPGAIPAPLAAVAPIRLSVAASARLLLLGAGPESPSLIACARQMGWFSTVIEHRGRWSQLARAAHADRVVELAPLTAHAELHHTRFDAALVMSHNFSTDLAHLRALATRAIGYIGLLGPPSRRDELLAELGADAVLIQPHLHAPVGLRLGGQGPEAIALSIAAELQQQFARQSATAHHWHE